MYFIMEKNWAAQENFSDVVAHLQDLGDSDINDYL